MSPNVISEAPSRVLVTGGAGFVGSPLVALLAERSEVVVVDDLSVGRIMPPPRANLTCYRIDIRQRDAMREVMERHRPQLVIHLAAIHHIPTCEKTPFLAMEVNVMGFQSVLDACRVAGCGRVVLASSGAIYDWTDGALSETARLAPRDVYSASKAANEHQLTAWAMAGGGSGIIARLFNIIGPDDPNGHLIPDILNRLRAVSAASVELRLGNLSNRRDFVDVRDMAAGLAALADKGWRHSLDVAVYNLCSGRDHPVSDIALRLAGQLGVEVEIVRDATLCRAVDRPTQLGDPRKTMAEVGWRATRSLDDSLAVIIQAWRSAAA